LPFYIDFNFDGPLISLSHLQGIFYAAWRLESSRFSSAKTKDPRNNNFPFYPSRLQVRWPDLLLHLILAFGLKRACYSSGIAASDRTNLTQIRAPKLWKLFLRGPKGRLLADQSLIPHPHRHLQMSDYYKILQWFPDQVGTTGSSI
jgi:hypothetical protein